MIVITNPIPTANEIDTIHSLFEEGMQLFHVRKPHFGISEMRQFLLKIDRKYSDYLVLHSHHDLALTLGIHRLHFSESKRKVIQLLPIQLPFVQFQKKGFRLSTSVHTIEDFNSIDNCFDYAFLSPVYNSISKENYSPKTNQFEAINNRNNYTTQLIALGGIESKNIEKTINLGFDDVALLGTIWNQNNPIENFKSCQKIVQSF
jgi:thiamine-phosphate pyrophosphorylase